MGFERKGYGFFFDQPAAPAKAASAKAQRAAVKLEAKGCDECTLRPVWRRLAAARMPMRGNLRDGDILVLGEAPREEDDKEGGPFLGRYWKPVLDSLPGMQRDRLVFQNLVRCCPMNEYMEAKPSEIHSCSDHLAADADSLPGLKAILGIGQAALTRFFPDGRMEDHHGKRFPVKLGEKTVWFYPVFDLKAMRPKKNAWSQELEHTPHWPVFQAEVRAFFKQVDNWPAPKISKAFDPKNVLLPETEKEARRILKDMEGALKGVDVESANLIKKTGELRPWNVGATILSGAISDGKTTMAFSCNHPEAPNDWGARLLIECVNTYPWTAHNLQMEYVWLRFAAEKLGIAWTPKQAEDSMALVRLHNRRSHGRGLDPSVMIAFGVNVKAITNVNARHIMQYPLSDILPYNGLDALAGVLLTKKYLKGAHERNYRRIVDSVIATGDMALMGLPVDFATSEKLLATWQGKLMEFEEAARGLFEVKAYERETGKRFQITSGVDVGNVLVDYARLKLPRTAKGMQYDTEEKTLKDAAGEEGHPLVDAVINHREAQKMVSTYIGSTLEARTRCADEQIHPVYDVVKTETLRFACEDPNIQNWPKRDKEQMKLRKQIVAITKDLRKKLGRRILYRIDYKALEARMIACATKDAKLCANTIKAVDIHGQWRDNLLKLYPRYMDRLRERSGQSEEAKILKAGRDEIKTDFVFASFFGSPAKSCAERTNTPIRHMERLQEMLWEEYPGVFRWIKNQRRLYKETGSVFLLTGVERHAVLPGNECINTPIQGTGAQVVSEALIACARIARETGDPHFHPRIQIHDDLTFILPDNNETDRYINRINEACVALRFDWQIVPLGIEGAVGYNWADMQEVCALEGDYVR